MQERSGDDKSSDNADEQLASRRAELEAEYDTRAKAAEDQFQKRADNMKKQLSSKLSDNREKLRQENEQIIQKLQGEHEVELNRLKEEHQAEIAGLKSNIPPATEEQPSVDKTSSASLNGSTATETAVPDPATVTDTQPPIKTEGARSLSDLNLSDQEIREFIAKNQVAKSILVRNVQQKISKEKEELAEKMKADQSKILEERLEEARKKSELAKDNAVAMEGKRHSVKLNMTENRLRTATAKLDVIETAARDTPQRTVGEVWAIAKDAKPVTVQPQQASTAASITTATKAAVGQIPAPPGLPTQAIRTPAVPASASGQPAQQTSFGKPSGSANLQQVGQPPSTGFIPNTNIPNVRPGSFAPPSSSNIGGTVPALPQQPIQQHSLPAPVIMQAQPAANAQARPTNAPNAGTGPTALRNIIGTGAATGIPRGGGIPRPNTRPQVPAQTGIPQPGGQSIQIQGAGRAQQQQQPQHQGQRNAGAGRGQGAGRGRGQGGPGGPSSPSMNPGAKQFVPGGGGAGGNKRPREEEGEGRGAGGLGKRARGGQGQGGGNNNQQQ